jgi:hypothetical protein
MCIEAFQHYDREERAVVAYLTKLGFDPSKCKIEKYGMVGNKNSNAMDSGDILVEFPDHTSLLFEVKEESYTRFHRYGDYGLDFISMFRYKPEMDFPTSVQTPDKLNALMDVMDVDYKVFKWGKLCYSKADVWLFFSVDESNPEAPMIHHIAGFRWREMQQEKFIQYVQQHCSFVVNHKDNPDSADDWWKSATFFIHHSDPYLNKFKIHSKDDLYGATGNFTQLFMPFLSKAA